MAAVAIAFNNDPEMLGVVVAILIIQIMVSVFASSYITKGCPAPGDTPAEAQPAEAVTAE